ncbi:MAG: hypothetical protein AAGD09_27500 [Cyanobacteria bacterium P01_F01_bin.56]
MTAYQGKTTTGDTSSDQTVDSQTLQELLAEIQLLSVEIAKFTADVRKGV